MEKKPKLIWRSLGEKMGLPSTQEPARVYDCIELGEDYKNVRYQCLMYAGGFTIYKTLDELLKDYPHVKI